MANFPRRYYPDYPGPSYSPYRSQYPALQTMEPGYPSMTSPTYRMEYPPFDTTTAGANPSKVEDSTASQGGQVINKRYKYYGYALLLMALAILGLEIGNVAFTYTTFKVVKKTFAAPYILTWIAPGIWGAIPVLITGYLAVQVAGKSNKLVRIFALFCSLSATVFTPAIIAVSVAEIIMYDNSIPAGDGPTNFNGNTCYKFSIPASLSCPKFILPLVVAVLGGVAFYLTMMVTIIFCCCWDQKDAGAAAETTETTQVIDEYYPYAPRNPTYSPPMMRPPPVQAYREPIYRSPPPNMDFLSAYPVYRPAASRGFGFAPAYNRQSYGYGGSYFPGTLPSLTNFGGGGDQPNPAYRVVYA